VPNGLFSKIANMDLDIASTVTTGKTTVVTTVNNMKTAINNSLIADFVSTAPGSISIESTVNTQGTRV